MYSGRAGGSLRDLFEGAANYLCQPNNPQSYGSGMQTNNDIHGAEYNGRLTLDDHDNNAPCAICYASTRGSLLMIPAMNSCPTGWTEEYDGYLISEQSSILGRTMYVCIDALPDSVLGQDQNDSNRVELTCVVCTR